VVDNPVVSVNNNTNNAVNDIVKTTTPIQNGPVNQENDNLNFSGIKNIQDYVIRINKDFILKNNYEKYYDKIIKITNEILDKYVNKEQITEEYFYNKLNIIFILFCKMVINYDENNTSELINNEIDDYLKNLIKEYEKDYNSEKVFNSELLNLLNQKYDIFIENRNNNNLPNFDKEINGKKIVGKIFAQDGQAYLLLMNKNENEKKIFAFVHLSSNIPPTDTMPEKITTNIEKNEQNQNKSNIQEAIAAAIGTTTDSKVVSTQPTTNSSETIPIITSDINTNLNNNPNTNLNTNLNINNTNNTIDTITSNTDNKNKTVKNPNPANNCCDKGDKRGGRRTYKNKKKNKLEFSI
jgi:hypothetical protein